MASVVTPQVGYEVHNFGVNANLNIQPSPQVFTLCYCPGFQSGLGAGPCDTGTSFNFPQTAGTVITISAKYMNGQTPVVVFPSLRFDIVILCGAATAAQPPGGCKATTEPKYKIIFQNAASDKPYYDATGGCRFIAQAATSRTGALVQGGHIGPANCVGPSTCTANPDVVSAMVPQFDNVQIDASYQNSIMIPQWYDLCYCDSNCLNSESWFKAAPIEVRPVQAFVNQAPDVLSQGADSTSPIVNTGLYVVVANDPSVIDVPGSWQRSPITKTTLQQGSPPGVECCQMKILADPDASVDKIACLNNLMPTTITGHRLLNGTTVYTPPVTITTSSQLPIGQKYGFVCNSDPKNQICVPNIRFSNPGWYAICYCDQFCSDATNWMVAGRINIKGPTPNQIWTRSTGVTFNMDVSGWGMNDGDQIMILPSNNAPSDCGSGVGQSDVVSGPAGPSLMAYKLKPRPQLGANQQPAQINAMVWDAAGTQVTFGQSHGLSDGDYITLSGIDVNPPPTRTRQVDQLISKMKLMYNNVHQVFVKCDDDSTKCFQILIPVFFPAATFPDINFGNADWTRSSRETYTGINVMYGQASIAGRGYVVCWYPGIKGEKKPGTNLFVGQAGLIVAQDPPDMPLKFLGLTTVKPETRGAPAVIAFQTGDVAAYATATGRLRLKIAFQPFQAQDQGPFIELVRPKSTGMNPGGGFNDLTPPVQGSFLLPTQAMCGQMFVELWSQAPDGFPAPDACYYFEDTVEYNKEGGQKTIKELHLIFGPGNHLRKNTMYNIVILVDLVGPPVMVDKNQNPVWIWSMDDVDNRPYNVFELGRAAPSPTTRVPPTDEQGNAALLQLGANRFSPLTGGFSIYPNSNTPATATTLELLNFCLPNLKTDPLGTPPADKACRPCRTEQDCGNGGNGVQPNPALSWCQSPISAQCGTVVPQLLNNDISLVDGEGFTFDLVSTKTVNIDATSILRIFLHPLTQWNLIRCNVAVRVCKTTSGTGSCDTPVTSVESVVGGSSGGYNFNICKITLPKLMKSIDDTNFGRYKLFNLNLPPSGFYPQVVTAEIATPTDTQPDYLGLNPSMQVTAQDTTRSLKIYVTPKFLSISLVTKVGDGNQAPFAGSGGLSNVLYARVVFGTTIRSLAGNDIRLVFTLPAGYTCTYINDGNGIKVPRLTVLAGTTPSGQGRLGGGVNNPDAVYTNARTDCQVVFQKDMTVYSPTVYYAPIVVNNPAKPLPSNDPTNYFNASIRYNLPDQLPFTPQPVQLQPYQWSRCASSDIRINKFLCWYPLSPGYGSSVSVLGYISQFTISPTNFGVSQTNVLYVFFQTQQPVGTPANPDTEIWVDAPSTFDFGAFCKAGVLDSLYYIPEGSGTVPIPVGDVTVCNGDVTDSSQLTYNRARVKTIGRLVMNSFYGFQLTVKNAPSFISTQLDMWRLWTYTGDLVAMDGTFSTASFNPEDPTVANASFGVYQNSMPPGAFAVAFSSLSPSLSNAAPVDITVVPIMVQALMDLGVRVIAPVGYIWDFEQAEFRYKVRSPGVPDSLVVPGVQADLPVAGVPARPNSDPRNRLVMDYMQSAWLPGLIYGFACKIRVPFVAPTGSANQFTIEFGYAEISDLSRLEGGVAPAYQVQRVINGGVSYSTNIIRRLADITFGLQTISTVPDGGAIYITGPPNFVFNASCQPKPSEGYPELPFDITCLATSDPTTASPQITILAGPSGIPAAFYSFALQAVNPSQPVPDTAVGSWSITTYSIVSTQIVLDQTTTVPGFPVSTPMMDARLIMQPKPQTDCTFKTWQQMRTDQTDVVTTCDFQLWQWYPPLGYRDDRPGKANQLIILFQLQNPTENGYVGTLQIVAPVGYIFPPECVVVTDSALIFNDTNVGGLPPQLPFSVPLDMSIPDAAATQSRRFDGRFKPWDSSNIVRRCQGGSNVASLTIATGIGFLPLKYLFRIGLQANPIATPNPNLFVVQFAGQASTPFPGIEIWAFKNVRILPTTTAASTPTFTTTNLVTIVFQPLNNVPFGGQLRIIAPSGFVIPTRCQVTLAPEPSQVPNITALTSVEAAQVIAWSQFGPADLVCKGDDTPSSTARLQFIVNQKSLKGGVTYTLTLMVTNPMTVSSTAQDWQMTSFRDLTVNNDIDSSYTPGFVIETLIEAFTYTPPASQNALVYQQLEFNFTFPDTVGIGESISLIAPISFIMSTQGDSRCPQYVYLDGPMRLTQPICGANTVNWVLVRESVPQGFSSNFLIQARNPPSTPADNWFSLYHLDPNGVRKSSRRIAGFPIIPQCVNPSVTQVVPSTQCRPEANLVTRQLCQATLSTASVQVNFSSVNPAQLVQFSATVNGQSFDFTGASFDGSIQVVARSSQAIVGAVNVYVGQSVSITINGIVNPSVPGRALWNLATYTTAQIPGRTTTTPAIALPPCGATGACGTFPFQWAKRSESTNLDAYAVLGFLGILTGSYVNPIYFGSTGATVSIELIPSSSFQTQVNDIMVVTRPPGYVMMPGTLQTYKGLTVGQNGLDDFRRFGLDANNPENYYMILLAPLSTTSSVIFTLGASLPKVVEKQTNWVVSVWRVLPILDVDGEILDNSVVPYPWLGRNLTQTGSNDGAFTGFLLVGQVPFTVNPTLQTPGASITLTLTFAVPDGVQAQSFVRVLLQAPQGYLFKDSCLAAGSTVFSKCTGYGSSGSLVSVRNTIIGTSIVVYVAVTNPGQTPTYNYWSLAVFRDDSTQYVRWSQTPGYEIIGMGVTFKGNNQLGETSSGYFTFAPVRPAGTAAIFLIVIPPPNAGFKLFCTGISPLGFGKQPSCQAGDVNGNLQLYFSNASLVAFRQYTFGITILNPGGVPNSATNYWGIQLQDGNQRTFDANLRIPALQLGAVPLRVIGLGWTSADRSMLATILIQLRVLHTIQGGDIGQFYIQAPDGIMYNQDLGTLRILPVPLPLQQAAPSSVSGNLLWLNLDPLKNIGQGVYNIRFQVSNPNSYPFDNTWSIVAVKDIQTLYTVVVTGYYPGQLSPVDVVSAVLPTSMGGATRRAARSPSLLAATALIALMGQRLALWEPGGAVGVR